MRKPFKLRCDAVNERHTRFSVYDPHGAKIGSLCLLTSDLSHFLTAVWGGDIQWNGLRLIAAAYVAQTQPP